MFALILDSLGSTELLFILIIALMFFGPRRLPQLSRTIGKSLAEFRKASEDFKRTWEREVALESAREQTSVIDPTNDHEQHTSAFAEPSVAPIAAEHVMARQSAQNPAEFSDLVTNPTESTNQVTKLEDLPKREWL